MSEEGFSSIFRHIFNCSVLQLWRAMYSRRAVIRGSASSNSSLEMGDGTSSMLASATVGEWVRCR